MNFKITFLGTGTSQGVPVIACNCEVCKSDDHRDRRLRTSVLIQTASQTLVIDTGPDFRYQMLRADVKRLDAVLLTHEHRDHIAGLDDVRTYNFRQKMAMPIYASDRVIQQIKREFHYAFEGQYPGLPQFEIHKITNEGFGVNGLHVLPISVMHHKLPVFGFRIGDFTYITDANAIPDKELNKIEGSKVLVLDALQREPHLSHFTLAEALKVIEQVQPEYAYLTHISHKLGRFSRVVRELPPNVSLAYDGLTVLL